MRDVELFGRALGLREPWRVVDTEFDAERKRLDLRLDFARGARFACPKCDREGCEVHDSSEKTWRHLDFFQHQAYLTARVPRVRCPEHGVHQVRVPWARPGSGFTLLFEALAMALVAEMPVRAVGELVGEHDTRVWRIVHHYVDAARERADLSHVTHVGLDDTSFRRGQDYVTVFADLDERRAVFATEGRDSATVERFVADLEAHGGDRGQVAEVCQDMSQAYQAGVRAHLPDAQVTFDRYHVKALLSKAVDEVRRAEAAEHRDLLARSRYLWLRRPERLTDGQRERLDLLLAEPLETAEAYRHALAFDRFYEFGPLAAEEYLYQWCERVIFSDLEPLQRFAETVLDHWAGVIRWLRSKISNGLLEGLNSLIQASKRRARGYRSTRNYIAMIYLVAGNLDVTPKPT